MTLPVPVPKPSYSQARENLVKAIPPNIICLLACGGSDCRYEGPLCWRPSQQAIKGVFSSWVTDNIVAMARPSTYLIKKYSIIEQFRNLNIRSIINMQLPGEHAHCGPPLEPDCGFTYSPQVFMENDIFFYNFGMPDFCVSSLAGMLDGVKVLAFAVRQGKVAVHCHAGLGRTGVLIACYLIYELRVSPSEAVHFVRLKRPRSIQTRAQINLVFSFARLLATQLVLYPDVRRQHGAPVSLCQHLQRQGLLLHGEEARRLKSVPKVVDFLCTKLVALSWGHTCCQVGTAELERQAAVLELTKAVRSALLTKTFRVLLGETGVRNASVCSAFSWDEPQGFLERKNEVLLNKRSYSDSDLSKIALYEDPEFAQHPALLKGVARGPTKQEPKQTTEMPVLSQLETPSMHQSNSSTNTSRFLYLEPSAASNGHCMKMTKCKTRRLPAFMKFMSTVELERDKKFCGPSSVSRAVAIAMAEQDPLSEDIRQRSAVLQGELNRNTCGWAVLATESDPCVLSCLLWLWLEKLREPVLDTKDVEQLSRSTYTEDSLRILHKSQGQTITCLLSCVSQVTSLCPRLEDAVLYRLVRALIRCPLEEVTNYSSIINLFKDIVKGMRQCDLFTRAVNG